MAAAKQPTRTELEKEAGDLRTLLEGLSDAGVLDLSKKDHAEKHARLDELERALYVLRRRDRALGVGAKSGSGPAAPQGPSSPTAGGGK